MELSSSINALTRTEQIKLGNLSMPRDPKCMLYSAIMANLTLFHLLFTNESHQRAGCRVAFDY